ncbi:MAG TPA: hypothetical protein VIQ60_10240 [Gemmatimonadaceae bacterium]
MNRLCVIAVIPLYIFAIGCATTPRAPSSDHRPAIPISASSMPSGYGVQLRLSGSAVVRDDWLYVEVPAGSVRTYQGTTDAWDLMIRAGLARCTGKGKWRIVSESRAARIAPLVGLTRDSSMLDTNVRVFSDTLHLDLGVPRGTDMQRAWVTFEIAWPFQSVLAEYTLPTGAVLASPSERQEAARSAGNVCR